MKHADVRVGQAGDRPGFTLEPLAALGIRRQRGRQNLDGDVAIQPRVAGPIDLSHATGAERPEDLEGAESRARIESRRRVRFGKLRFRARLLRRVPRKLPAASCAWSNDSTSRCTSGSLAHAPREIGPTIVGGPVDDLLQECTDTCPAMGREHVRFAANVFP